MLEHGRLYIGIGAERAGTTWIHSLIRRHPEVEKADKELKHFVDIFRDGSSAGVVRSYASRYSSTTELIQGEWTPRYMYDFWAPAMLAEAAPQARFLVSLRDPLARMRSGLTHSARQNLANTVWMVGDAFSKSLYGVQMERVVESLGSENLLVLQFEQVVKDPLSWLPKIYQFIGCEDVDFVPDRFKSRVNWTEGQRSEIPEFVELRAMREFQRDASRLKSLFREIDLDLWPSVSE